jgi:hypothetical protein
MPKATKARFENKEISIHEALTIRKHRGRFVGYCVECNRPVSAFKKSVVGAAHFEHRKRNPACNLSDHRQS